MIWRRIWKCEAMSLKRPFSLRSLRELLVLWRNIEKNRFLAEKLKYLKIENFYKI